MKAFSKMTLIGVILLTLIISCEQNIVEDVNQDNINTFKMTVNGLVWTPSVIDSCHRTFICQMSQSISSSTTNNFYTIEAYRDPSFIANLSSENFFEIHIINLNKTGSYIIDGVFEDLRLNNVARLTINDLNGKRRYQNKKNDTSFKVNVTQLFPSQSSSIVGIGGSFSGTLFNIDNSADSIIIKGGEFIFKKTNHNNFNQCKE